MAMPLPYSNIHIDVHVKPHSRYYYSYYHNTEMSITDLDIEK
jgi:hypothetical protein